MVHETNIIRVHDNIISQFVTYQRPGVISPAPVPASLVVVSASSWRKRLCSVSFEFLSTVVRVNLVRAKKFNKVPPGRSRTATPSNSHITEARYWL